jgi:hypothetical protein
MRDRGLASRLIVLAILTMVVGGAVAASVVLAPEYGAGQAAIRNAAALPDPPMRERQRALASGETWFIAGGARGAWREIVDEPSEPLWLSRPHCGTPCRARRALVLLALRQQHSPEMLLRAYIATRSERVK